MEYTSANSRSTDFFAKNNKSAFLEGEMLRRNIETIEADIKLLRNLINFRLSPSDSQLDQKSVLDWPSHQPSNGPYSDFVHDLSIEEWVLLLIALLPHYSPRIQRELVASVQDGLLITNPHLGGYVKRSSIQFIPSLETVIFLCAGTDMEAQHLCYRKLIFEGQLIKRQIISLNPFIQNEPVLSDKELIPELAEEYVQYLLHGRAPRPDFGKNFPAKLLTTNKNWDQMVLMPFTKREVELLIDWVEHGEALSDESKGHFGPGYPALFFGPPGTGKSLTAALIGKRCGLNVFRVDASRVVSKYIGETEKNLVQLFERMKVENQNKGKRSVLFFDEADVLFSKRTEVKDAKDKWANMETSVLLPLIEEYDGLVIIATNFEHNLDEAMDRRFQLKIKFPTPSYQERILIWQKALPSAYNYPTPDSTQQLARYKLSPAAINNILKGGCLQARKRGSQTIIAKDLEYFISMEFAKSGLTPSWENIPMSVPISFPS